MPWPLTPKVDVTNHTKLGELFIELMTGRKPIPASHAERKQLLEEHGLKLGYQKVEFLLDTADTIHLVLREKDIIAQAERDVTDATEEYPLDPIIYSVYSGVFVGGNPNLRNKAIKQRLFAHRICDYCVSLCA